MDDNAQNFGAHPEVVAHVAATLVSGQKPIRAVSDVELYAATKAARKLVGFASGALIDPIDAAIEASNAAAALPRTEDET